MTQDEIDEAWAIFGNTPGGNNARQLLVRELMSVCPASDRAGALDRHEGRRSLARELIDLMDRHSGDGGYSVNTSKREPRPTGAGRSLRRVGELDDAGLTDQQREQLGLPRR